MEERTVLIVEDDPILTELYTKVLKDANIAVITAPTGADGYQVALAQKPDLILMDVGLPDEDGHAVVARLRLDKAWGRTAKVIYLTNHSDPESVFAAVTNGSANYIIKAHATPKEVLNRVRSAMFE